MLVQNATTMGYCLDIIVSQNTACNENQITVAISIPLNSKPIEISCGRCFTGSRRGEHIHIISTTARRSLLWQSRHRLPPCTCQHSTMKRQYVQDILT